MFETIGEIFTAVALKYLSATDIDPATSNGHEIGGLKKAGLGVHLGTADNGEAIGFDAEMAYLSDDEETLIAECKVSWYDSRYGKRSPEWRLYYPENEVIQRAAPTDLLLIALTETRKVLMLFCPQGSQSEVHLRSIFGAIDKSVSGKFSSVDLNSSMVDLPIRLMLARYGIQIDVSDNNESEILEILVDKFKDEFPKTADFSKLARKLSSNVSVVDDPDHSLITWMDYEERMFRIFERHLLQKKLDTGFSNVDEFIKVSLSVQNRRKSRVGHAFENHISEVLRGNNVKFVKGVTTELKKKPDFLFPGEDEYRDVTFDQNRLFILGAKTTCKERWRQVLSEAKRIKVKHLITLEPSVSSDQTEEMKSENLQLVVPEPIQASYKPDQVNWLMSFKEFIAEMPKLN